MSLPDKKLEHIKQRLCADYPDILIIESQKSYWNPQTRTIYYNPNHSHPIWSLLHEVGHMVSGHINYSGDVELLMMEAEAWKTAKVIAKKYGIIIDQDHIEDCLDSYREWLYRRSKCPGCGLNGLQSEPTQYTCPNCTTIWKVSKSRFKRSYRRTIKTPARKSSSK